MIRVLVADDHPIVRQGLKQTIADSTDIAVTGEADTGEEVINLVKSGDFDVVLLDISMPVIGGIEVLKQLKLIKPALPVLILSVYPEEQYAMRVLKAGAAGYLQKTSDTGELLNAIRTATHGKHYVSASLAQKLAGNYFDSESVTYQNLSDRELEVLRLIVSGKEKKAIADELRLSPQSVSTYRARILNKLALSSDAELVRYAIDNSLID